MGVRTEEIRNVSGIGLDMVYGIETSIIIYDGQTMSIMMSETGFQQLMADYLNYKSKEKVEE